jgi:hypothetical protein
MTLMIDFDVGDEPPAGVRQDLLWRVANRLYQDHGRVASAEDEAPDDRRRCRRCRQPWPCSGRRLAELALINARG